MGGSDPLAVEPQQSLIEVDIDRYGQDARGSALADYLELAALAGIRVTKAALRDLIVDNEWVRRPVRRYLLPADVEDDPDSWSESVFSILAERGDVLGAEYPFTVKGQSLVMKERELDRLASRYLSLLAITVVHAWSLPCDQSAEATLEEVVADTLNNVGMSAVGVGATDRGMGFVEALREGGAALGLRPSTDPRPRSASAKDVGVDTLAGVVWRDSRQAGHWITIGQVTTAQSQLWRSKLAQPEPARWANYLQEQLHPQVFLAVPHHVQRDHLIDLMESRRGVVIDRLRLASNKPENSPKERQLIAAMLAARVERP